MKVHIISVANVVIRQRKKDYLKWHVDPYHEGGCFICDQCSYMVTRKGELKQHVESHHDGVYYNYNKYKGKGT